MIVLGIKNWLALYFLYEHIAGDFLILIVNFIIDIFIVIVILKINKTFFGKENLMFLVRLLIILII